jgi:hypothetical protein
MLTKDPVLIINEIVKRPYEKPLTLSELLSLK